jgi:hypothetical protein
VVAISKARDKAGASIAKLCNDLDVVQIKACTPDQTTAAAAATCIAAAHENAVDPTDDDYRFNSETAIVAAVSRNVSFKTSYAIRFDNTPEPGFTDTDRLLTTGLQIRY